MSWEVLDLRTLAKEWREIVDELEDAHDDSEADHVLDLKADAQKYVDLCSELGIDPAEPDTLEWQGENYEPTLIHDDYFEQYAEELARDIGAISDEDQWPLNCIDWEKAADQLRQDYTTVEYDGNTYYTRSY